MPDPVSSFSIFNFCGELSMCADSAQPPWVPGANSLSAASVEAPTPSIVVLRHRAVPGGKGPKFELKFHNLGPGGKKALAAGLIKAAREMEKRADTDDTDSMNDEGFAIDITAALMPAKP
jgi:hypothetical protein